MIRVPLEQEVKKFMTVAKVILHGAFLARVSVCAVVCASTPGNAGPAYLPSTHRRSLGASEKAAKAPAESRGKPVEGAAAAPKSHRRSGPDPNPAPSLRHSSRPLYPTAAAARVAVLRWSWSDAALTAPANTGQAVKKSGRHECERRTEVDYSVGVGKGGEHECAWIQPAEEGCRYALKGEKITLLGLLLRIF